MFSVWSWTFLRVNLCVKTVSEVVFVCVFVCVCVSGSLWSTHTCCEALWERWFMRVRVVRQKPSRSVYSTNTKEHGGHSVCCTHATPCLLHVQIYGWICTTVLYAQFQFVACIWYFLTLSYIFSEKWPISNICIYTWSNFAYAWNNPRCWGKSNKTTEV